MNTVPDRRPGESASAYYLRLLEAAPDGSTIRFDEASDEVEVVEWADTDAQPEGE